MWAASSGPSSRPETCQRPLLGAPRHAVSAVPLLFVYSSMYLVSALALCFNFKLFAQWRRHLINRLVLEQHPTPCSRRWCHKTLSTDHACSVEIPVAMSRRVLDQARQGVVDPSALAQNCTFDSPSPGIVLILKDGSHNDHRVSAHRWEFLLDPLAMTR